ncbi:MAG: hypothetical protein ACMZ7B_09700 [Balneola sp.]
MKLKAGITALVFFVISSGVFAQQNQLISIHRDVYSYIKKMQQRGKMLSLNPTSQPYTQREVSDALKELDGTNLSELETFWKEQIESEIKVQEKKTENDKGIYASIRIDGDVRLKNYRRPEAYRPLNDKLFFPTKAQGEAYFEHGIFGGQLGSAHIPYYSTDLDGIRPQGTLSIRNEFYYFGIQHGLFKVYVGRFANNWGLHGEGSAILSDNPAPYDQFNFSFGNSRASVQSILGELDNLAPNGEFRMGKIYDGTRRFITTQRFNWRPSLNTQVVLFFSAIYAGENANTSLKYLNPFNILFSDRTNYPENEDTNMLFGGSLWGNFGRFNLHGQLIIDDFHSRDNNERMTGSLIGGMRLNELFRNTDVGLNAEIISYQSYNVSTTTETRYVYAKRGLATQFNDYIYVTTFSEIYAQKLATGLIIEPRISLLFQGEQTINQPFYGNNPDGSLPNLVLTGTVETTLRNSIRIFYNPSRKFWIDSELGYNIYNNMENVEGATGNDLTFQVGFGFPIFFDGRINNPD